MSFAFAVTWFHVFHYVVLFAGPFHAFALNLLFDVLFELLSISRFFLFAFASSFLKQTTSKICPSQFAWHHSSTKPACFLWRLGLVGSILMGWGRITSSSVAPHCTASRRAIDGRWISVKTEVICSFKLEGPAVDPKGMMPILSLNCISIDYRQILSFTFAKILWTSLLFFLRKIHLLKMFPEECPIVKLGGWFQIFVNFSPTWGGDPIWLICFRRVETTNYKMASKRIYTFRHRRNGSSFGRLHRASQ